MHVVALVIVIAVVSDIGESLYAAPRVRLFESSVCTRYYMQEDPSLVHRPGDVPEHLCKVNPVQDELASVLGWQLFFDSIPAILLPVPYGYLADTRGRKQIVILAMLGYTLSYIWTLFAASLKRPYSLLAARFELIPVCLVSRLGRCICLCTMSGYLRSSSSSVAVQQSGRL